MKKIGFALMFACFILTNSFKTEEAIKWMDFNEGYALAKKKNKIMLVDVYTDWCGWCKRMDKDAYAKPEIAALVNKDYVAIKFNPEVTGVTYTFEGKSYTGRELAGVISNNQISGYPTTIFMYPKEKKLNVISGYFDAAKFKPVLENVATDFYTKKKK